MAEPSYEELRAENERLRRRISELEAQIERLTQALEASQRSGKRQAAPFSKGMPQPQPKKPGRKPGDDYGAKAHRPPPRRIDETYEAHLPQACPHCHSAVNETAVQDQYQVEIPRRPIQRRFRVHLGECSGCGAALQGRHPLQTSDALGAAGSGLGADAQASVCWLNKSAGLSHGKIVKLLKTLFGIELSRGGSAQIVARGGRRCEPAYKEIQEAIRGSPTNAADETGWRIGGQSAWQHVLVNERATCYLIDRSRGADVPARVLSFDYDGVLLHDGWAAYGQFTRAVHGQCNAHALRRAHELHETVGRSPRRWLRRVQDVFRRALRCRDRRQAGTISAARADAVGVALTEELGRLVRRPARQPACAKFARHLQRHLWEWFLYLFMDGLDATTWRAEQAIRPAVVNRKVWGGNRTDRGARAQQILTSVLVTCTQHARNPLDFLSRTLRRQQPTLLPVMGR